MSMKIGAFEKVDKYRSFAESTGTSYICFTLQLGVNTLQIMVFAKSPLKFGPVLAQKMVDIISHLKSFPFLLADYHLWVCLSA